METNLYPEFIRENIDKLTKKQQHYFKMMWSKYGVLFLKSAPGVAKSSILRKIAEKMNMNYIDLRLSMIDETDIGLYPTLSTYNDGSKDFKVIEYALPKWAIDANKTPTIIHFEELNRANISVRNAAMQILLERQIGNDFKFNENVLMVASGNLGEEDNTEVEEFDSALNNRLIHVNHELTFKDWSEDFGLQNVHYLVYDFLKNNYGEFYVAPKDGQSSYPTPRSWTMISEFIKSNFGHDESPSNIVKALRESGLAYGCVGVTSEKFFRFCLEKRKITIEDVLYRFDEYKDDILSSNRDKISSLLHDAKSLSMDELLNEKTINNIKSFMEILISDERVSFVVSLSDKVSMIEINKNKHLRDLLCSINEVEEISDIYSKRQESENNQINEFSF